MLEFKIPSSCLTVNKTIRMPSKVDKAVEAAIQGTQCTYSMFVIHALRWVLHELAEAREKFPAAARGSQSVNKTIRIPNNIVTGINRAIIGTGYTFSSFVICAVRLALEALKNQQTDSR